MEKNNPIFFIGHGSPMNAIANNSFTESLVNMNDLCPAPTAILCISAHWLTAGTFVTHMKHPKTIHDFGGFPKELFAIEYPAPGSQTIADLIISRVAGGIIQPDDTEWGLDHGTWSVLRHVYPKATIPVLQLSIDVDRPPRYHFEMGQRLKSLRQDGLLIVGSGNIVHNLRKIRWEENAQPFDWATEFDGWIKEKLLARDFDSITHDFSERAIGQLSVPTPEHYYPLLYVLGASEKSDQLTFTFEGIQNGSISMRSFSLGP